MAVKFAKFDAAERKVKGGGVRPGYSYQGVTVEVPEGTTYDSEAFLADTLEISGGNFGKAAEILAEGFNSLAEKAANPVKDATVKAVIAAMKSVGQAVDVSEAIRIAETFRAKKSIG